MQKHLVRLKSILSLQKTDLHTSKFSTKENKQNNKKNHVIYKLIIKYIYTISKIRDKNIRYKNNIKKSLTSSNSK